jgi:DNA-binding NtrC family response regulator
MPKQLPIRVLVVDDQQSAYQLCAAIGLEMGLVCSQAKSAAEAIKQVQTDAPELILADMSMGDMSGLALLAQIKKHSPRTVVAVMSACSTIETAVEAMRLGACDFIVKPFHSEKFKLTLKRMVESLRFAQKNEFSHSRQAAAVQVLPVLYTDLEQLERLTVQRVFAQVAGDKEKAQKLLGISRATLYRKIKRYGLQRRQGGAKRGLRDSTAPVILLSQS